VVETVIDRRGDGILRFPFCIPAPVSKIGGRPGEVSGTRRGTASPAKAKLLSKAVLENRSHAVGQSSDNLYRRRAYLAACLSCIFSRKGEYVPVIDGPRLTRLDVDAEVTLASANRRRA